MGILYDERQRIEQAIKAGNLDEYETKGAISLKTGFILTFIKPETPDDPEKLRLLKQVAKEVLSGHYA